MRGVLGVVPRRDAELGAPEGGMSRELSLCNGKGVREGCLPLDLLAAEVDIIMKKCNQCGVGYR